MAALVLLVATIGACDAAEPPGTASPTVPYGTPIEAGPPPDPMTCRGRLGAEIAAAVRIRTEMRFVPGLETTEAAARAAAADPEADTATFGIPLSQGELLLIRKAGLGVDDIGPISTWVHTGAADRFGGIWLDGGPTVAVVNGDPSTLGLARCLEHDGTRYVWADISYAEGTALGTRIIDDRQRWQAAGIDINTTSYGETTGLVTVGVTAPTDLALKALQAEYGPRIRLEQAGPIRLL